jgi:tRNA (guanosine-2'-O-)-methyltransferase
MTNEILIKHLEQFTTERRKNLFYSLIKNRTRHVTVVLEDIYQPQNASAVLRTCDCMGIQDVHIIENNNKYRLNPDVTLGSEKWLTLKTYNNGNNNTIDALKHIKAQGYRIVATTPHRNDINLEDFDVLKGKAAFLFGTEKNGLSKQALKLADEFLKIPMFGFTESFNISVSAAIILFHIISSLKKTEIKWQLSVKEQNELLLDWLKISIRNSKGIISNYLKDQADKDL